MVMTIMSSTIASGEDEKKKYISELKTNGWNTKILKKGNIIKVT